MGKVVNRWALALLSVGMVAAAGSWSPQPASATAKADGRSPDVGKLGDDRGLLAVTAVSATDAWAVGYHTVYDFLNPAQHTLIKHWDGTVWTVVPSPRSGIRRDRYLDGVSSVSARDVWAVGTKVNSQLGQVLHSKTLTEHWDGTSWVEVASPNPPSRSVDHSQDISLSAVDAVSGSDVWAVGTFDQANTQKTLVLHWDGSSWTILPSPSPRGGDYLAAVSAVSANDVWAVGGDYSSTAHESRTLTEHWDGTSWTAIPMPNPGPRASALEDVSAVSATDVWAVGYSDTDTGSETLVEHWDGTSWTRVPSLGGPASALEAVSAVSASDAWAVGYSNNDGGVIDSLIEHWDGTSWTPAPSPATPSSRLHAVSADATNDAWAVSTDTSGAQARILVEHWDGTSWSTP